MKKILFATAASVAALAAPAHATTVLSDNFDSENGGNTALNYTGFANWNIIPNTFGTNPTPPPSVDLVKNGDYGIGCVSGSGACVDLDGSTSNGASLISKNAFVVNAGDIVTISLQVSGNQRGGGADQLQLGSRFVSLTSTDNGFYTDPSVSGSFINFTNTIGFTVFGSGISSTNPFSTASLTYRVLNAGAFYARIGTDSDDNVGLVVDNVQIDVSSGVPEPATWALMILGFGAIGAAMRRRARTTVRYA